MPPGDTQGLQGAYQELQEQTRQRTLALAGAAHELKTPLAIMGGYIELLRSQKTGSLNNSQRQILAEMACSWERLQRFVHDFLTYSALETRRLNLNLQLADLNPLVSEVYSFWLHLFQKKKVAFYFLRHDSLEPLLFDPHKIQQAVSNLLDNALKFTRAGGTVWLTAEPHFWERRSRQEAGRTPERRQESGRQTNSIRVTVADTGPGIAPEYHKEIFDDFFKLADGEGSGLGLAIARRLIEAHEGKIWVESEPGVGSKFSFLLPLEVCSEKPVPVGPRTR